MWWSRAVTTPQYPGSPCYTPGGIEHVRWGSPQEWQKLADTWNVIGFRRMCGGTLRRHDRQVQHMTDSTPNNQSLPPLGAVAPSASTPPPPPPPMSRAAMMAAAASAVQATATPIPTPTETATASPTETATATPTAATTPTATADSPESPSGRKRSLVFALVAVLAVGGVAAGVLVGTGGDSSGDSAVVGAETPEAPSPEVAPSVAPVTTESAPATTVAPPTTQAPTTTAAPTTTEAPTTTQAGPSFPTLPDGSPEPIVAIYDGPTIRVVGWVPSQEKADQLEGLALANSTDPTAQVDAMWSIDPSVPLNIGTRVIEMNSPRFGAGSADVTPEHAAQLDRVANVLNLLPNVTVTVVGHADQKGDEAANYALSEARAVSVVGYLVGKGVAPSRLSARAFGEQDLLAADESEASLALNRRTEFIFYGLLTD